MAVGQAVLTSVLDVGALNAVETRLEVRAVAACAAHAGVLREVLELHRVLSAAGAGLSAVPQVALLLQVSEGAASQLLAEAQLLAGLPGGLEALECGLLTVGQSAVLLRAVRDLTPEVRLGVWEQLQARLVGAAQQGVVLPPARLASVVAKWVVQADPVGAQERRRRAEAHGDVSYRRREDGLGDLFATAVPAPVLQAVLCRVRAAARPFGPQDARSAGKRRLDALLDLLLGRQPLPLDAQQGADGCTTPGCGCRPGTAVPCGVEVLVHVPLGAALGTTDELAELVGHGPLHPDELAAVLTNAPRLQVVRVDADGVPVSVDDRVEVPVRGGLDEVRRLVRAMAAGPPGPAQPRYPFDHPDRPGEPAVGPPPDARTREGVPGPGAVLRGARDLPGPGGPLGGSRPRVRAGGHPPGTAGPYRPPRRVRRLVQVRAPRCEWPGCGVRAQACDLDHDRAHPAGATCACNTGPLCRRHHRVKQLLMTKTRVEGSAVRWTSPTGRTWTSPPQHTAPARAVRPQPVPHAEAPGVQTGPDADRVPDVRHADDREPERASAQDGLRADEPDTDPLADRIRDDDGWDLALDDPYRWTG